MSSRPTTFASVLIAVVVLSALGVAAAVVARRDPIGQRGNGLSKGFQYDLEEIKKIDPELICYRQTAEMPLTMSRPRAIAAGPNDRVYVAGDKAIHVFAADGQPGERIDLEDEPRCLAIAAADHAAPGRIYVGMKNRVEVYEPAGKRLAVWSDLGEKANLTSIAVGEDDVLVADAGNRIVLRYDLNGKLVGRIGGRDKARNILGFVIPSPYFDVAVGPDGLVRAVNPGAHRIESYTLGGDLEHVWGKIGTAIDRFCGCCNPSNFAILSDGRFVTVEKGLPRVKVYSAAGEFECVVAGTDQLATTATITEETRDEHRMAVHDVAVDSRDRVLLLDPEAGKVRIFEPKSPGGSR